MAPECIRVLIVMPQANLGGGAELMLLNFLHGIRVVRPGWRCSVVFLRPGAFVNVLRNSGFAVASVLDVRLRRPVSLARAIIRLSREIKAQRADIVFSWVAYAHLLGGLASLMQGVPAVWYQIGSASGVIDRVATLIPARSVLCVSHFIAGRQTQMWPHRPVTVVWPGIDLIAFSAAGQESRSGLRARLGLPVDGHLAVMVGRLQRWKGMHTAIAAMPAVVRTFPETRLVIVGGAHESERDYGDELLDLIRRFELSDHVVMAGLQQNIAEWMGAADVVLHASREEPFGIVAVEAMACGRPVITGKDGGVSEAVRDGIEGSHVPFGNHRCLAETMIGLFQDGGKAARMGAAGIARARLFSIRRYAEEICCSLEQDVEMLRKNVG